MYKIYPSHICRCDKSGYITNHAAAESHDRPFAVKTDIDEFIVENGGALSGGLDGGAGADTLSGPAVNSTWTVNGAICTTDESSGSWAALTCSTKRLISRKT